MNAAQETRLTADDLIVMPDEICFELVNGQLVDRNMSEESRIYNWLANL